MNQNIAWQDKLKTKGSRNLEQAAEAAAHDSKALQTILDGLSAEDNTYRENCFRTTLKICEMKPELLYPKWDDFAGMLNSANAFLRAIGLQIIAGLVGVDRENRFEEMFDKYFSLMDDDKIMVSRYLVQNVGSIIESKPHLKEKITDRLLRIEETRHPEGRKALLKADVVAAVDQYYDDLKDKERILAFAEAALHSSSPKARKAAQQFLSAHT